METNYSKEEIYVLSDKNKDGEYTKETRGDKWSCDKLLQRLMKKKKITILQREEAKKTNRKCKEQTLLLVIAYQIYKLGSRYFLLRNKMCTYKKLILLAMIVVRPMDMVLVFVVSSTVLQINILSRRLLILWIYPPSLTYILNYFRVLL